MVYYKKIEIIKTLGNKKIYNFVTLDLKQLIHYTDRSVLRTTLCIIVFLKLLSRVVDN